jgi:hypothetical protein
MMGISFVLLKFHTMKSKIQELREKTNFAVSKKTMWIPVAAFFSVASVYTSNAQSIRNVMADIRPATSDSRVIKAVRNFWQTFGDSKNETWYYLPEGALAEFQENGVSYRVSYSKKGEWVYTLKQYTEKELPEDVRAQVKSVYYDYRIGWVKEVDQAGMFVYLVHIENERESKTIRLADGEMEVAEVFQAGSFIPQVADHE